MKILLLNGSPKAENSDTMHLSRAFLQGMEDVQPNQVQTIHVIQKNIGYCQGCFTCKRNGGTCVIQDDMEDILNRILDSDVLVFSFPLYCYGMPAPLKALLDRTMPLSSMAMRKVGERYEHPCNRDFSKLRYVMICGCGFPNAKQNFEGMVTQFRLMFDPDKSTILTVPESPMFNAPEAVSVTEPFLKLVRQAGQEYARTGAISPELMTRLQTPMIPDDAYAAICNGEGGM